MALLSGHMWKNVLESREASFSAGAGFGVLRSPWAGNRIGSWRLKVKRDFTVCLKGSPIQVQVWSHLFFLSTGWQVRPPCLLRSGLVWRGSPQSAWSLGSRPPSTGFRGLLSSLGLGCLTAGCPPEGGSPPDEMLPLLWFPC